MPPRRKAPELDVGEMFRLLGEKVRAQSKEPNILGYQPHAKQEIFHKSTAHTRLYIGGNRSGKTVGGICEDIFYMRGQHPYKRVPEAPTRGRIVTTDFNYGLNQIIVPKLKQWLPPSMLINGSWEDSYSKEFKLLTLSNGSTVEIMTYEQDPDKFQGTSRHWIHFDEEPPKAIYDECQLRLLDVDGDCWLTMTPVEGMSWVYDGIYVPGTEGDDPNTFVVEIDIHENPHLPPEAIDRILANLDPEERAAREKGTFVELGGKVFKKFDKEIHIIPALDSNELKALKKYEWYLAMDHGFNNPTAFLWNAVKPDGTVITFAEHYAREMTIEEHAKIVNSMNDSLGKIPEFTVGDPATAQRNAVTGTSVAAEYAKHGIFIAPGNNDVLVGVAKMQSYLKKNPKTGKPFWQITENCSNLTREMARLRWKTYSSKKVQAEHNQQEQIHKKDDHAPDAERYLFATLLPDVEGEELGKDSKPKPKNTSVESYDQILVRMHLGEDNAPFTDSAKTEWKFGTNAMEWDF